MALIAKMNNAAGSFVGMPAPVSSRSNQDVPVGGGYGPGAPRLMYPYQPAGQAATTDAGWSTGTKVAVGVGVVAVAGVVAGAVYALKHAKLLP
jgi:hypothetical protein